FRHGDSGRSSVVIIRGPRVRSKLKCPLCDARAPRDDGSSETLGAVPIAPAFAISPVIVAPAVLELRHREAEALEAHAELVASAAPLGIGTDIEVERKVAPDVLEPSLHLAPECVELGLLLSAERGVELVEGGTQRLERGFELFLRRLQLPHRRSRALVG